MYSPYSHGAAAAFKVVGIMWIRVRGWASLLADRSLGLPIFDFADYAIVGDVNVVVPAITQALKARS